MLWTRFLHVWRCNIHHSTVCLKCFNMRVVRMSVEGMCECDMTDYTMNILHCSLYHFRSTQNQTTLSSDLCSELDVAFYFIHKYNKFTLRIEKVPFFHQKRSLLSCWCYKEKLYHKYFSFLQVSFLQVAEKFETVFHYIRLGWFFFVF